MKMGIRKCIVSDRILVYIIHLFDAVTNKNVRFQME